MAGPKLDAPELQEITGGTLDFYEHRAESFRDGTRDHDVSQNIDALLGHIAGRRRLTRSWTSAAVPGAT